MRSINVKGERKHITFREAITQVLPQNENAAFDEKIRSLDFGLIDLYFPIKEWRKNWQSNNKLQIASVGWNEQLKKEEVFTFTTEGNEIKIPANIKPSIATLVVYPSEKQRIYKKNETNSQNTLLKNNSTSGTNSVNLNFTYKVIKVRVNRDYDSGWFGGSMEIYITYQYKPTYWGYWGSWHNTSTVDVDEDVTTNFNKTLLSNGNQPHIFRIGMFEWDGYFNGSDDLVCDTDYYTVSDENGNYNLETTDIYIDWDGGYSTGNERNLVDGPSSDWSKIWVKVY